jgi:N-acetylneuraminic acid mutarotase
MTLARFNGAAVAYKGYLYVSGGQQAASTFTNTVEYAPLNADGSIGTWTASANTVTTARYGHVSAAYNGKLYVVGGGSATNVALGDVKYATINANGTIGAFTDTTATTANRDTDGFIYGGRLYITGGLNGTVYSSTVRYATINADGTLGTWTTSYSEFTGPRSRHATAAMNGYIYIFGGATGLIYSDLQYAPINADGSIGTWKYSNTLNTVAGAPAATYYHTAVADKGRLYSFAGNEGTGTAQSATYMTTLNTPPMKAEYSKLINFGQASTMNSIVMNGTLPIDQNVLMFRTAGVDGVFGAWQLPSVLSGAPQADVQYVMYRATFDDGTSSDLFSTSGRSTVADITLDYTVPAILTPANRLRHNKFFDSGGVLQPLQTQ